MVFRVTTLEARQRPPVAVGMETTCTGDGKQNCSNTANDLRKQL